jgi:hemolysin activation/secretion protein
VYKKVVCLSAGFAWGIVGVCASTGWAQNVLADGQRGEQRLSSSVAQEEFEIRGIRILIKGSTVFRRVDFAEIVKEVSDGDGYKDIATKLVRGITELYLEQGYITTLAESPTVNEREIEIQITEGKLSNIVLNGDNQKDKLKGEIQAKPQEQFPADGSSQKEEDKSEKPCVRRLSSNYIRSRIQKGLREPFNSTVLEEQLKLLRFDPMLSTLEADLKATENKSKGLTDLTVRWCDASSFFLSASVDNYSPPSVGSERLGVELAYRNLLGLGDTLAGSYFRSTTGGSEVLDLNYQVPLNGMNGTLFLRYSPSRSQVTQVPFDELGIRGKQQVYEVAYRQPIVRTLKEELALSLGLVHQTGQTFLFDQFPNAFGVGPDENGVSRTSVLQFGQNYVNRDSQGLWGFRSQFNFGTGLFGVTRNENPVPDGLFFSWNGQVQRLQKLGDDHLLVFQADLQLTPESLLPSQQFTIGGAQSVRGFRQNQRSGDNGFRLLLEDRIMIYQEKDKESGATKLGKTLQVVPFFNMGKVWNRSDNPNLLPRQNLLIGGGLGLLFEQPTDNGALTIRVDYGASFLRLDDRGNNAQDNGVYFSVRYQTK